MSNSLDPDQARQFVQPDLGPNCLPRLSADDTGRKKKKELTFYMPSMTRHNSLKMHKQVLLDCLKHFYQ